LHQQVKIDHLNHARLNSISIHPIINSICKNNHDVLLFSRVKVLSKPRWSHRYLFVLILTIGDKKLSGVVAKLAKGWEIEVIVDNELLSCVTFHWILGESRTEGSGRLDRLLAPIGLPFVRISMQDIDVLPGIPGWFRNGGLAVWQENRKAGRGVHDSGVCLPSFPVSLSPLITFRMFRHENGPRACGKSLFTYIFNYAIPSSFAITRLQIRMEP